MSSFNFVMLSAGFEHGGNVTHRYLDGHPELFVYPFESQLGNRYVTDFLSSIERVQYRYPEFPIGLSLEEYYELFYDEELKTYLRKPNGSKFKDCGIIMSEEKRKNHFIEFCQNKPITRALLIEAFFVSTFVAWENYQNSGSNFTYVGYSPAIGIDSEKMIKDFPNMKIIHIVRNPFSAYANTKKRPFPLDLERYIRTWNIYHHTVLMLEKKYSNNIKIVRFEDIIDTTQETMSEISSFIGIDYSDTMLYPSFNSKDISENISPWGAVQKSTPQYNIEIAQGLSKKEIDDILSYTQTSLDWFNYFSFYNNHLK